MNFFGIGASELLLILVIAMLVVGPERMVKFARDAGQMVVKLRKLTEGVTTEFHEALDLGLDEEGNQGQASGGAEGQAAGLDGSVTYNEILEQAEPEPAGPIDPLGEQANALHDVLASSQMDGEIEVRLVPESGAFARDHADSMEAVEVPVAFQVPEDIDVEPTVLEQALLVADESVGDAEPAKEG